MPGTQLTTNRQLPNGPGTYALILHLAAEAIIRVGRLGALRFHPGSYIYVGSALGAGGLAGRLRRHLSAADKPDRRLFWHIDYLRQRAQVETIWFEENDTRREHHWATLVQRLPGAALPAPGFGASDCACPAHLFHFQQRPKLVEFKQLHAALFAGDVQLQQYLSTLPNRVTI